jgi:hypothetical protein
VPVCLMAVLTDCSLPLMHVEAGHVTFSCIAGWCTAEYHTICSVVCVCAMFGPLYSACCLF